MKTSEKKEIYFTIATSVVLWFSYILGYWAGSFKSTQITLQVTQDQIRTEWVKAAKEVEKMERDTIAADSIYSPQNDAVR